MIKNTCILLSALFLVGGCQNEKNFRQAQEAYEADREKAKELNELLNGGNPYSDISYTKFIKTRNFVNANPVVIDQKKALPRLQSRYTLNVPGKQDIGVVTRNLTKLSGIAHRLAPELLDGITRSSAATRDVEGKKTSAGVRSYRIEQAWNDLSLLEILNLIEAEIGLSWEYDEKSNIIEIYRYKTHRYSVHVPSEIEKHSSQMSNDTGSGGGGETSLQGSKLETSLSMSSDFWKKIEESIEAMVSAEGRFSLSPATFSVFVTDTEAVHRRIEKLIASINAEQLRQIIFSIDVYRLSSDSSDIYGLNFDALYESADTAISLTTGGGVIGEAASLVAANIRPRSDFYRSTVFVDALSRYGEAALVDHFKRVTLNNRLAPVMIYRNTPYLKEVGTTLDEGVSQSSASLTDLITGFSLILRPHLINSNEVLVTLSTDRKSVGEFERLEASPGTFLERPDVEGDSHYHQVIMKNHATMVLAGYMSRKSEASSSGMTHADAWWAGGKRNLDHEHSVIVITVKVEIVA